MDTFPHSDIFLHGPSFLICAIISMMKRKNDSQIPDGMMHQWRRPPRSCSLCRVKKLRCDRGHPCSNCTQRNESCVYAGREGLQSPISSPTPTSSRISAPKDTATQAQSSLHTSSNDTTMLVDRIQRLEEMVFDKSTPLPRRSDEPFQASFSPFGSQPPMDFQIHATGLADDCLPNIPRITGYLPPLAQARQLFNHFASCMQPTFGVLHIPSTKTLMEDMYEKRMGGGEPTPAELALIFTIFAGAATAWTPSLLETLQTSQQKAKQACTTYSNVALLILDNNHNADTSTTKLQAITTLVHVLSHGDGVSDRVHILRVRQLVLARNMQIHRLDTPKRQAERKVKGANIIELEVQRRAWWHMVSTDWLHALLGGPQEGIYLLQPKHMNVNYPMNTDDELITPSGPQHSFPLSVPTIMSVFHYRTKLAELCREVVDTLPEVFLDPSEPVSRGASYDAILALDAKFRDFLDTMPLFFKLDPASIQQSRDICRERPYIAWQRTFTQFGIHVRICRLHQPFHLAGITDPKYAYSRKVCVESAETVLNLRRTMDEIGALVNLMPSRFWVIIQHLFLAAIMLATDVALDPGAPEANSRKDKVLAACQMLERSQHESSTLAKAIRKNTQTLLMILQNQASASDNDVVLGEVAWNERRSATHRTSDHKNELSEKHDGVTAPSPVPNVAEARILEGENLSRSSGALLNQPADEETWGQLWLDMFNAGLESDGPQWSSLLEELAFTEFSNFP
ncbi:hypothetical protein FE257_001804 [Aspergillus nanangensis]|uniref:Zn(2)-C6 fungal-type domain-containing protein n=1 Tax=Aspergillus nanangensis TaxID=2582783 RepID=A0AAD4CDD1_ASPNN|nr:hypothetical protein FE257_001804 [Aspergillus nanangensis]